MHKKWQPLIKGQNIPATILRLFWPRAVSLILKLAFEHSPTSILMSPKSNVCPGKDSTLDRHTPE